MKLNRILVVLMLLVMSIALFACSSTYEQADGSKVLTDAIKMSFDAPASYITIKDTMTFTEKDSKGEPKKDADGNKITKTELATRFVINTYVTEDAKYPKDTRLTYIEQYKHDEFGYAGSVKYWAGTEKKGTQGYLITSNSGYEMVDGVKVSYDHRLRQKLDNLDILSLPQFAAYNSKVLLADIYNLTADDFEYVSGTKEGHVDTIKIKIKESHSKFYSDLGVLTFRVTNGYLKSIQANDEKDMGIIKDVTTKFQIDILQAGAFITIPTTAELEKLNSDDKGDKTTFTDDAVIVLA